MCVTAFEMSALFLSQLAHYPA